MKETLLLAIEKNLLKNGFQLENFSNCNYCFDFIARKQGFLLLIKALGNIDALRKDNADELRKVALGFKGVPLIVGIKSKIFSLQKEILYERYGITTISIETLNSLLSHSISSIKYFKGKTIAELDSVKLKEKRKQFNLTLRDLADRVGLTKESMHRIEKGKNSSLDVVKKLEKELNSCLIKDFSLKNNFCCEEEKEEELNDPLFEKLMDLGLEVKLFHKTPFNATAKEKQEILVSKANKQDLKRKALNLGQAKKIFNSSSMILTNKCRYQSINSTPVFEGRELDSISSAKDLVKIIKERENRK